MRPDSDKFSVQLLGPLSAILQQQIVTPTAAKQRRDPRAAGAAPGQLVTRATLAEELWGSHPPRSFAVTLQTYIFQLRRRLANASPEKRDTKHFLGATFGYC